MTAEELRIVVNPNSKFCGASAASAGRCSNCGPQASLADERWTLIAGGDVCPDCLRTLGSAGPGVLADQLEKMAVYYEVDMKRDMQERLDALTGWAKRLRQTAVEIRRTEEPFARGSGGLAHPPADEVGADDDTDPVTF